MIVGTPIYMSPEQVSGGEVDGRSDLYSLGIMFYELLTGRPPYQGDTPIAVCMQHLTAPIPKLPPKLADLDPILERMLAKKREERYDDMQAFTRAMREVFLHSETLRGVIASNPDMAWSEQLRELGFSFDTLREGDLRALRNKPATPATRPMQRPQPKKPAAKPAAGRADKGAGLPRWLWPALGGVALLLVSIGAWLQFGGERLNDDQLAALTTMVRQFDRQLGEGQLVQPAQDSALQSLRGMYAISRSHNLVSSREEEFRKAVAQRLDELIAQQQFGEGRALLMDAKGALKDDAYEAQLAQLDQAQQAAQRDAAIAEQIDALKALLAEERRASAADLAAELTTLRELTGAEDKRYTELLASVGTQLSEPLQAAIAARDLERARQQQTLIDTTLPGSSYARTAAAQVQQLQAELQVAQTLTELERLLSGTRLGVTGLSQALADLDSLGQAKHPAAQIASLENRLIEIVAREAAAERAAGNLMQARALVDPLLARRGDASALTSLSAQIEADEQKLAAARRAEEEAARAGRLALDAMPWGELVTVTGSDGKTLPLPEQRITPLLLTLPEGDYTLALKAPDGATKQLSAKVTRGQLAVAELKLGSLDPDQILREAGYR
jgi:hypothetical protein